MKETPNFAISIQPWWMHVDKNADGHVVDQNMDWVSREIAYVPLGEGIRSKRSYCMQIFFFFEWVQDMLT